MYGPFENLPVPVAASRLLAESKGNQRNAEAAAWQWRDKVRRDENAAAYFAAVAICIFDGGEVPPIERQAYTLGTPHTGTAPRVPDLTI